MAHSQPFGDILLNLWFFKRVIKVNHFATYKNMYRYLKKLLFSCTHESDEAY